MQEASFSVCPWLTEKENVDLNLITKWLDFLILPLLVQARGRGKGSEHLTSWLFVTEPHAGMWALMATRYVNATSPTAWKPL